jgi:hypothetical protein
VKHIPVVSPTLLGLGFDPRTHALDVVLRDNIVYCYDGVPESVWSQLLLSTEQAAFVARELAGRYPVTTFALGN